MANRIEFVFFGDSKQLQGAIKDLDRQFGGLADQSTTVADRMIRSGDRLSKTLTPALAAAGLAAIKSASDQEQALGALESQLGDAQGTVLKFAETSADAYGLSREQVARLGSVTAAQLQSFGFENEQAAETTVLLQQRAADLAATFGGPVESAVSAVSALLRGERDPIERYGVAIKQADINARLAADGLNELEGEERRLAEAQVGLTLFMEQTAKAAGQFGREAETTAGQTERLKARTSDLTAELGTQLLPIAEQVLGSVNNLVEGFASLPDPVKSAAVQAVLFGTALGPILSVGGRLTQALTPLAKGFKDLYDAWSLGRSLAGQQTVSLKTIGTAVGGVTIAIGLAVAAWQAHQRSQAESRARVDELTDSLDANTGALTENTRELAVNQLEASGALEAAQKYGIALDLVTAAALGDAAAQRELRDELATIAGELKANKDSSDEARAAYVNFGREVGPLNRGLQEFQGELELSTEKADRQREANFGVSESADAFTQAVARQDATLGGLVAGSLPGAIAGAREHADAMGEEEDAAEDDAEAFTTLADRIRNATNAKLESVDPTFRAMEAERRAAEAVEAYREALDDENASLGDKQAALEDAVRAQGELEAAQADAIGTTDKSAAQIREWGRQAGLSEGEIDGLVDRVGELGEHLRNLKGTYTANVQVVDASGGKAVSVGQIGFRHRGGLIDHNAPGRVPGLGTNERLTALEVGEEVLTADDPRHQRNIDQARPVPLAGAAAGSGRLEQLLEQMLGKLDNIGRQPSGPLVGSVELGNQLDVDAFLEQLADRVGAA